MRKILSYMQIGILTVLCLATSDAIAQAAQPTAFGFKVTLLGTSTPNPLPDRLDRALSWRQAKTNCSSIADVALPFGCGN
jgi:hypothetical protein